MCLLVKSETKKYLFTRIDALRIHFSIKLGQREAIRECSPFGIHNLEVHLQNKYSKEEIRIY